MRYTVLIPHAKASHEYGAYLPVAAESGINIADTERVKESAPSKRWLPVWQDESVAQQVAQKLREVTESSEWAVQPLNGEPVSRGPLGPVWIHTGRTAFGYVYELSLDSEMLIERRFPQAIKLDQLCVDTRDPADIENKQAALWQRIAEMLTGLSAEQLESLGGYRFYAPRTEQEWGPALQPA